MADLEAVRRVFQKDRFATEVCGIEILEVVPGRALCEMKITEKHMNAGNVVQGGAIFTLGDFAYAIASNCGGTISVTLDNNISFMAPATGAFLRAEAKEVSSTNRLCFYDVSITDDKNALVAKMTVTGYKKGELTFE